jgi:hypothetical protein
LVIFVAIPADMCWRISWSKCKPTIVADVRGVARACQQEFKGGACRQHKTTTVPTVSHVDVWTVGNLWRSSPATNGPHFGRMSSGPADPALLFPPSASSSNHRQRSAAILTTFALNAAAFIGFGTLSVTTGGVSSVFPKWREIRGANLNEPH